MKIRCIASVPAFSLATALILLCFVPSVPIFAQEQIAREFKVKPKQTKGKPWAFAETEGKRWAFLVGINEYQDPNITQLRSAVNDIKAFKEVLIQFGGFDEENVLMMTDDENGTRQPNSTNILLRLDKLAEKIAPEDIFVFYFAGHGITYNGEPFLLPYDSSSEAIALASSARSNPDAPSRQTLNLLNKSTISLEEVQAVLSTIAARQILILLDACRNSPLVSRGEEDNLLTAELAQGVELPSATAILYACSVGQRAWEMQGENHGVFSYYLLEGLRGKAANPDGTVTISSLAEYTKRKVAQWANDYNRDQTPMIEVKSGEVVVASIPSPEPQQPLLPEENPTVATLHVTSEPEQATVYLNNERYGITPLTAQIGTGNRGQKPVQVRLELVGYKPQEFREILLGGKATPVHLTLEPLTPSTPVEQDDRSGGSQTGPSSAPFVNRTDGATMRFIPAGTFRMGSPYGDFDDATPSREVELDAFYIDQYEVTNEQFRAFIEANPQWGKEKILERYHDGGYLKHWDGNNYPPALRYHPVVNVSWYAAVAYAEWAGKTLPTEAQWERAARGQLTGAKYPWGNAFPDRTRANFGRNVGSTTPRGGYHHNGFILYDMVGNVWEWCMDNYHDNFYKNAPSKNPLSGDEILSIEDVSPNIVEFRVFRGGAWDTHGNLLDVAFRKRSFPDPAITRNNLGFRCVKNVEGPR